MSKSVPNPLPCGCGVMGIQDLENAVETGYNLRVGWKDLHVKFCPLHAAAPDLLAATQAVARQLPQEFLVTERYELTLTGQQVERIFAALTKAEGR